MENSTELRQLCPLISSLREKKSAGIFADIGWWTDAVLLAASSLGRY